MQKRIFSLTISLILCISIFASNNTIYTSNDTIRVLTIGNSFSEDAVENFLYELGQTEGITFIIGNMLIGGCSLEKHWNNASNNLSVYSYRKIEANGLKTVLAEAQLSQIISSEPWDYISFQQVSSQSGMYNTYFPYITKLLNYTKELTINPNVKNILHQTWAYAQNSTHKGFANYNHNQQKMYTTIVETINQVANSTGINIIIPTGTSIQNARTSKLGDTLCRDGHHLNLIIGRYIAACTWYEKLTGRSVIGNEFAPATLSSEEINIAQQATHNAILYPNVTTYLVFSDIQTK